MTNELVIVTNFVSRDITGLEVVGKVNELYSSVFNQLLVMLGIVATFVVVVLPYFLSVFQRRESRVQEAKLLAENKQKIDELRGTLRKEIEAEIQKEKSSLETLIKETEARVEKKAESASAQTYHIQAMFYFSKEAFESAIKSAIVAGSSYIKNDSLRNLPPILFLIQESLARLTKESFETESFVTFLDTFLEEVETADNEGLLSQTLTKLREDKKAASKRQKT